MNRDLAGGVAGRIGVGFAVLVAGLGLLAYVLGWFAEGAQVVQEQFGATASLKKYEAFKDWAAQLDAKAATLKSYQNRLKELENSYAGRSRSEWTREDREQFNLWQQYIVGIRSSYNALAAEYNVRWPSRTTPTQTSVSYRAVRIIHCKGNIACTVMNSVPFQELFNEKGCDFGLLPRSHHRVRTSGLQSHQ